MLVGQAILGWDNDLVDRERDERHEPPDKPIGSGLLDPGTAWFSLTCALLLVVPLSARAGARAGGAYLLALLVGLIGNRFLRGSVLSFLPWVVSSASTPPTSRTAAGTAAASDTPPTVAMTVLAALLGLGVHFLRALPGLVPDNQDGLRSPAAADRAQDRRTRDCWCCRASSTGAVVVADARRGTGDRPDLSRR